MTTVGLRGSLVPGVVGRTIRAFCVVLAASTIVGLTACGGTSSQRAAAWGDVVVRVAQTSITKAMLAHWTAVETVLSYEHKQVGRLSKEAYEAVEHHILEILIIDYWAKEEAASRDIRVSDQEVAQALHREFPTKADFESLLAGTGETAADQRLLIEHELLERKLGDALTKNWTVRTDCRAGYVVEGCKQYGQPTNTG